MHNVVNDRSKQSLHVNKYADDSIPVIHVLF